MTKHHPENERIKRAYFLRLKQARGLSEASIAVAAAAIHRFEQSTGFRSFQKFHIEQAMAFSRKLEEAVKDDGKPLSLATMNAMRAFVLWLAEQPGYRTRIRYSDADYFRLSEKDTRAAKSPNARPVPTPEQIEAVLAQCPTGNVLERRNRAMIAFTWLTGVRDGALVSLRLKHVDLDAGAVNQDPREVNTKNSKPQVTTFFQVGGCARQIVQEWVEELRQQHQWGRDDPLFPATAIAHDADLQFKAGGIARRAWSTADAARKIFREAFEAIGLPGFNPHSFRHALAMLGEERCASPLEFKAWSQNLGHEGVLTTLSSYGEVPPHRQAEIIKSLARRGTPKSDTESIASRVAELIGEKISSRH